MIAHEACRLLYGDERIGNAQISVYGRYYPKNEHPVLMHWATIIYHHCGHYNYLIAGSIGSQFEMMALDISRSMVLHISLFLQIKYVGATVHWNASPFFCP